VSNPTCFSSLGACALRVAKLTSGGVPVPGASNGYVSTALVSVGVSVEISEGDDLEQKNGCGDICATFKQPDRIKRLTLSMDLCQLDTYLINFLTGAPMYTSGGLPIGWQFTPVSSGLTTYVSFEVWSKAIDAGTQAVPAFTSPNAAYFHWVFPKTQWTLGDVTIENGIMTVPVNGFSTENSVLTADGPFNDWPAAVAGSGGVTSVGGVFLDGSIPSGACAPITVPATS
jgi:hypothetical protein